MKARLATLILALALAILANGQITEIGSTPVTLWHCNTLVNAGPKLVGFYPGSFTIYNMDLTQYLVVACPWAVASSAYDYPVPMYISEDLFDTDPSTIEFLVTGTISGNYGTKVFRTDGTEIFSATNYAPAIINFYAATTEPFIYNTPNGTQMNLTSEGLSGDMRVYSLPGSLGCLECDGSISGFALGGQEHFMESSNNLGAYPNPTTENTTITYDFPASMKEGWIVLYTMQGAEIKRFSVRGSGSKVITTVDLPAATYLYQLQTNQGVLGTKRLIVVK
ncbi:MAG: T9SS type A sorting domain-containing protein [Flavobacteriales bacterium]|nr:T9SS type A sorting domain-containing protein [Flavobacteriales bacterium]MBK6945203.1 T9SS type A sorting domain-containing protein [Flavobacteriales bacterium]MBK7239552.1 T9SS type A sorting domain-containing protein [Flavobacteriales bacterium]MBK7296099.1 T9SS type A sorting domain-containing protein [Flavobacteriales bacterium]MBK9535241.1 T9SS type A sorting domain-containing protein [Flavobacteriales bacterium]